MKKALIIVVVVLLFGMSCAGLIVFVLGPFYDPWHVSEYEYVGPPDGVYSDELLARYPQYALCDVLFSAYLRGETEEVYEVAGPFTLGIVAKGPRSNQVELYVEDVVVASSLGKQYSVVSDGVLPVTIELAPTSYYNPAPENQHAAGLWRAPIAIDATPEQGEVITVVVRIACAENDDVISTGTIEFLFEPVTKSGPVRLP